MAVICRDHKLLFIMVPGTGCSVVGGVLRNELGGEWLPEKDLFDGPRLLVAHKHCSVPQLLQHGVITPQELASYTVFATVRNPYDRFVTDYQRLVGGWTEQSLAHQKKWRNAKPEHQHYHARRVARTKKRVELAKVLGFDGWLLGRMAKWRFEARWMNEVERRAHYRALVYPFTKGVETLIRYESLEDDLNQILATVGAGPVSLPRRNVTPGKAPYPTYYSSLSRVLVRRTLTDQLAEFGYRFDEAVENAAPMVGAQ